MPRPPEGPRLQAPLLPQPEWVGREGATAPPEAPAFLDRSRLTAGALHVVFGEGGQSLMDQFSGAFRGRTPSLVADLESGLDQEDAEQAQRLRAELRGLDAELVQLKAKLVRAAVLRGPSGRRLICDESCMARGCGEEFAEEDGVLCSEAGGCGLFLCNKCFGQNIAIECQADGRFDKQVDTSPSGSMPCPLFPQGCSCGHVPVGKIRRALLDPVNRGSDGELEDVSSDGLSPHKVYLIARRRWAEAQRQTSAQGGAGREQLGDASAGTALLRTYTEAQQAADQAATVALVRTHSGVRRLLDGKLKEVEELKQELALLPDAITAVPVKDRRTCLSCFGEFAAFEGAQCQDGDCQRFLCSVCWGSYILRSCSHGGAFEAEFRGQITQEDGKHTLVTRNKTDPIASAQGCLPCPFFVGHGEPQLAGIISAEMQCHCGSTPLGLIESVLSDPRNGSPQYWRARRQADVVDDHGRPTKLVAFAQHLGMDPDIDGNLLWLAAEALQAPLPLPWVEYRDGSSSYYVNADTGESTWEHPLDQHYRAEFRRQKASQGDFGWSMASELLGRDATPASMHETARLRVANAGTRAAEMQRLVANDTDGSSEIETLTRKVVDALVRGAGIQCPKCGTCTEKDEACVHMDNCPCGSHWCFLCGKESGRDNDQQCPRGDGARTGCDMNGIYLERLPGWGGHAKQGETPAFGAVQELLRRRQAVLVRKVKEAADPASWQRLRDAKPELLSGLLSHDREIPWDSVDSATLPLFGANAVDGGDGATATTAEALLAGMLVGVELDEETLRGQERMMRHFVEAREREERERVVRERVAERRRRDREARERRDREARERREAWERRRRLCRQIGLVVGAVLCPCCFFAVYGETVAFPPGALCRLRMAAAAATRQWRRSLRREVTPCTATGHVWS